VEPVRHPVAPVPIPPSFLNISDGPGSFSLRAKARVAQAIQNGWAKSTVNRYAGSVRIFLRFCDMERVPEHLRFPADEFVLCAFAAASIGKHARGTPSGHLSALKAWHVAHNLEWQGSARLRYVLNGVHNMAPGSSKCPPRPPINARMLIQLIQGLDLSSPFDIVVAACAVVAFWGQCRLGELLPASLSRFIPTLFPSRSAFLRSLRNPQACLLRLPHTKTHMHGQDVVLVDQQAPINPISLLKSHLRINNIANPTFIFAYTVAGDLRPLTKPIFLQRCNQVWQSLGYPRTTGHSFRIGGTTELLTAGTPPDVVKAMGRWSSGSFLRYWRSLDDIAPHHVRYLHSLKHRRRT
jgi:hypothetical protein